ncbi:DUF4352 domain-containing protein [Listeria booriae]|uniref:DUF4352 domain-containing protein n=1 Tax=Listeria booriae TaxID=1552123 RepID=A0A7X0Z9B6_9LIST|nr:DUF4352 domain-containing protein [Listeria booriae]MBC2178379.1 DUF4352 domain-containing protein [Listeria booriae]
MKKKITLLCTTILLSISLVACSKSEETDLNQALGSKEITVTPTQITREKTASNRKNILKVEVKVKNNTAKSVGIGAGNFTLKDDNDRNYEIYGMKEDSLGQEVEANQTINGNIYFEIPKELEKGWLSYTFQINQEPSAEWLLAFPNK